MHNPTYQGWWNTFNILGITKRLYVIDIKKLSSGKDWVFTAATVFVGFPDGISGKQPTCQCRRLKRPGFDSWVGRSPGGGHSNQLQYSCLENPMDRGAWQVTVHRVPKSWTRLNRLSTHAGTQAPKKCLLGERMNGDSPMVPGSQQRPVLLLKL